jgi:hypothetical protein
MADKEFYGCKNGCKLHPDCFTCPFPDCKINTTENEKENSKKYYNAHKQERIAKNREYQTLYKQKKRIESLKKEFPQVDFGGAT